MAMTMKKLSIPKAGLKPEAMAELGRVGVNFHIAEIGFRETIENIGVLSDVISFNVANVIANSLIHLMSLVQPRVPYYAGGELGEASTGKLRESGTALLTLSHGKLPFSVKIATGRIDGSIGVDLSKVKPSHFKGNRCQLISGNITYFRVNPEGEDIALWAHESMYAYEDRPAKPAGRTPGTGPKYLEIPWIENKDMIVRDIQRAVKALPAAVRKGKKTIRRSSTRYDVDVVKLVMEKIAESGYYGGVM